MEPIPKEVIEMAEDFYLHLNKEEKNNLMVKYFKDQRALSVYYECAVEDFKFDWIKENGIMLYFVIVRCFQYYNIILEPISNDITQKTIRDFINNFTGRLNETIDDEDLKLEMDLILHQKPLIDYIHFTIFGTDEIPVKYDASINWFIVYFPAVALVLVLNNEMRKHIGDEVN
jgi:hypothetical protein